MRLIIVILCCILWGYIASNIFEDPFWPAAIGGILIGFFFSIED